jgi:hypothetical protein
MAQALVAGLLLRKPGIAPGSVHMEFVVAKVALGQVLSQFFGFPCQYHPTVGLHTLTSPGDEQ